MKFNYVVTLELIYPQLHSAWTPAPDSCQVLNIEDTKLIIIVTFVTDIVLLLIMLAGLLHQGLRCFGTSMPSMGSLLLKQVGVGAFPWP
jgi:hypothetical protein